MTTICIIPARGGSTRIPRKNIKIFHGLPMLAYPIYTARASRIFNQIIVSSDDDEILAIAKQYGADVHKRSDALSQNDVGTQEVMRDVLEHFTSTAACCLYPCTPLLRASDLIAAHHILQYEHCDYVASVGANPLRDAGAFYFGHTDAFKAGIPLFDCRTLLRLLPDERVCDINTPEDWARAESLYAKMHFLDTQGN